MQLRTSDTSSAAMSVRSGCSRWTIPAKTLLRAARGELPAELARVTAHGEVIDGKFCTNR
jgi:hypothetical protein